MQTGMEFPGSRNDILLCAEPQPLVEHCKEGGDCLEEGVGEEGKRMRF